MRYSTFKSSIVLFHGCLAVAVVWISHHRSHRDIWRRPRFSAGRPSDSNLIWDDFLFIFFFFLGPSVFGSVNPAHEYHEVLIKSYISAVMLDTQWRSLFLIYLFILNKNLTFNHPTHSLFVTVIRKMSRHVRVWVVAVDANLCSGNESVWFTIHWFSIRFLSDSIECTIHETGIRLSDSSSMTNIIMI